MREYFRNRRGFIEVPIQSNLSILAACEDPQPVGQFVFGGKNYPLPQTGQIVLEEVLLLNPDVKGVYCLTTSFRDEPYPIEGRHDLVFPMFEFAGKGYSFVKNGKEVIIVGEGEEPLNAPTPYNPSLSCTCFNYGSGSGGCSVSVSGAFAECSGYCHSNSSFNTYNCGWWYGPMGDPDTSTEAIR